MINEQFENAYCAGYVDGDGCLYLGTTIQKPNNILVYECSIQVLSVKFQVLEDFKTLYGGCICKKPIITKHKPTAVWTVKGQKSFDCARKLLPFLVDKRIGCNIFLEMADKFAWNCGKSISDEQHQIRQNIIKRIKEEKTMNDHLTKELVDDMKEIQQTVEPTKIDFAYFAGLLDSEGCFRIKKWKPKNRPNEVYTISVEIGNTRHKLFKWLKERFGGTICYIKPKDPTKLPAAIWTLSANALFKILPYVYPHLRAKKEVCGKLIEFQETILSNGGDRHSELFHALFKHKRDIREQIIREVHELNSKGS
jgi:hypothetical protein